MPFVNCATANALFTGSLGNMHVGESETAQFSEIALKGKVFSDFVFNALERPRFISAEASY